MDTKIVGKYFQSENIAYDLGNSEDPKFLNNIYFQKIDFEPVVPTPILHKKAKVTDLISTVNGGGSLHLIMSDKLKSIIEKCRKSGLQFFETAIIKDEKVIDNYFSINMYETNMEFIDFTQSKISVGIFNKEVGTEYKVIKVNSLLEFNAIVDFHKGNMEIVTINNIVLNENIYEDFFMLKNGVKHIVSENLKKEIEDAGCTGIEFQPVEYSINEWLHDGHREKIYGKS